MYPKSEYFSPLTLSPLFWDFPGFFVNSLWTFFLASTLTPMLYPHYTTQGKPSKKYVKHVTSLLKTASLTMREACASFSKSRGPVWSGAIVSAAVNLSFVPFILATLASKLMSEYQACLRLRAFALLRENYSSAFPLRVTPYIPQIFCLSLFSHTHIFFLAIAVATTECRYSLVALNSAASCPWVSLLHWTPEGDRSAILGRMWTWKREEINALWVNPWTGGIMEAGG